MKSFRRVRDVIISGGHKRDLEDFLNKRQQNPGKHGDSLMGAEGVRLPCKIPSMPPAIPSTLASFVPTPSSPTSPSSASGMGLGLNASGPRVLRHIDPTVTFMSRAALQAYSSFKVMKVGAGSSALHSEQTELELLSSSCMPGSWSSEIECTFLYRTAFVPRFWDSLCRASGEYMRH